MPGKRGQRHAASSCFWWQADEKETPAWVAELRAAGVEVEWGQKRPLVVETAFTGMNSTSVVLDCLGIQHQHVATADPKPESLEFLRSNRLFGSHHFSDVALLRPSIPNSEPAASGACVRAASGPVATAGGACVRAASKPADGAGGACVRAAHCSRHDRLCAPPTSPAPDLVVLGFPCQPWSTMRAGRHCSRPPSDHPQFQLTAAAINYVLRAMPPLAVLENTCGLTGSEDGSDGRSGIEVLEEGLGKDYWVAALTLDLGTWVAMARPRQWILCVARRLSPDLDVAARAARGAKDLVAARAGAGPPRPWQSLLHRAGTQAHTDEVLLESEPKRKDCNRPGRRWEEEAQEVRSALARQGFRFADERPWEDKPAGGLPPLPRAIEMLNLGVLAQAAREGLQDTADLNLRDFWVDVSQNPCRKPWKKGALPTLCTSTQIFSYEHERLLTGHELARMMGWPVPFVLEPTFTPAHLRELLGESMALPPQAVAVAAILRATRDLLPDLF